MDIRAYQLDDLPGEVRNFFSEFSQHTGTERHIYSGNNLLAVVFPTKSIEELESAVRNIHHVTSFSSTQTGSFQDKLISAIDSGKEQCQHLQDAYTQLLLTAAAAIVPQQMCEYGHNERIALYSGETGYKVGCSEEEISAIKMAALLHDIGEMIIPVYLLQKSSKLTKEDWDVIKDHPRIGAEFVNKVNGLNQVAQMIHSHHEKYDGSGYPQGLKGEEIPIGARIISIVDAYDAMTNQRIHRNPKSHLEAIAELHELAGTCYDPQLVDLFEQCF